MKCPMCNSELATVNDQLIADEFMELDNTLARSCIERIESKTTGIVMWCRKCMKTHVVPRRTFPQEETKSVALSKPA